MRSEDIEPAGPRDTGIEEDSDERVTWPEEPEEAAAEAEVPFVPMHPLRAAGYFTASLTLALSQGFGQSVISANLLQLQGSFGATQAETVWLSAAYLAPNVSLTLVLIKVRNQFGLRNFAEISIIGFLAAALLNYAAGDLQSAMAVRFMSGAAAAPMTSLAFLYMLEPLPPERKMTYGLCAALTLIFMGPALTQLVSPYLLEVGLWHGLTALEAALAMVAFGLIYLLPLGKPQYAMKVHPNDITSYIFIAIGMGSIAVALVFGPIYWWTSTPWIGWLLALGIVSSAIAVVIELNRKVPLLDIRWIMSPAVLQFAAVLLVFRIVLSEQTSGAAGLFRSLGLMNEQMQVLNLIIIATTIAGGVICAFALKPGRERLFHIVALILLIIGALMDSNSTSQTVPSDMYISQTLIALASALFLPPALLSGMMSALEKGYDYILSFVIVFLTTQKVGGILGGSLFSTFIAIRQRLHLERIDEQLSTTDPLVQERLAQYAGAYGSSTTDAGASAAQGAAVLQGQAQTEASVMAYNDAFLTIAVISGVALAALLIHIAIDWLRAHPPVASDAAPLQPQAN